LNETYLDWHEVKHAGLSFDVVALRDIEEDEEVLIDYGIEWERAWLDHVANYDSPRRGYVPAFEMNAQADLQIKTTSEANYESIDGILTHCRRHMVDLLLRQKHVIPEDEDPEIEPEQVNDEECYPCRVVHRNHNDSYIAEVITRVTVNHPSGMWEVNVDSVEFVLFNAPRDTFIFEDAYYARDHHQDWSFRHDMRVPDEMFPDVWRRGDNQDSVSRSGDNEKLSLVQP